MTEIFTETSFPRRRESSVWIKTPRRRTELRPCPLRGVFFSLDSRLRGNDENGLAVFKELSSNIESSKIDFSKIYLIHYKVQQLTATRFSPLAHLWGERSEGGEAGRGRGNC